MPSDSTINVLLPAFEPVGERRWSRPRHRWHVAVIALSATIFAGAGALVPSRVNASPLARSAARSTVQTIPAGLARAIHARIGPGPIGVGSAPLISGISPTGRGWSVKDPSQSVTAAISATGSTSVSLAGSAPVSIEAVSLVSGSAGLPLSAARSALRHGRLVQDLGAAQSLEQVTNTGLEQKFVIAHPPVKVAETLTLTLSSAERWRVVRGGSAIQVAGSDLLYGGLRTADATGRVLPSHFSLAHSAPQIVIDSHGATYPITIDPTWASSSVPAASLVSSAGKPTDFGYSVAISADDTTALVGAYGSNLAGTGVGAVFVYRVTSAHHWSTTSQPWATITPSGGGAAAGAHQFGYSVALSADGTTALIGSPSESSSGSAAYVYHVASETSWASTVTPKATIYDGSGINDGFGDSVALSSTGTTALIGAPTGSGIPYTYAGEAYIFRASSETSWASTATPTATLSNGATQNDDFGYSVALSTTGTTALIGSRFADAYVFRVASVSHWASTSKPTATLSNGAGPLGYSVALSGDGTTALVGAPLVYLSTAVGAAYVFQASAGNVWSPSPSPVATLTNGVDVDQDFASSVALSANGKTALVGAYGVNTDTGAAYIFSTPSERAWSSQPTPSPKAILTHGGGATNDGFGSSLTLSPDGTTAFIDAGSPFIGGTDYVYHSSGSGWSSSSTPVATVTVAGNPDQGDIGYSVALSADGTTALVGYGSPYSDVVDNYVNDVYVFHSSSEGTWSSSATSVATLTNGVAGDMEYGSSVTLSADGTIAFVGDIGLNGNSGAVYVYRVPSEGAWSSKARLVATLTDAAATGDSFGWGIALSSDGTTALIGNGLFGSETDSCQLAVVGDAYVFHVSSESAWSSSSKPTAALADGGSVGDCFGSAVALSANGTTALIGAYGAGSQAGAAYVFHASSESAWSSSSKPKATLTDASAAWFGWSLNLSADGSTALIGAPASSDSISAYTGSAYVFHASSESAWSSSSKPEATLTDAGPNYYTVFGWSVALEANGTTALIGGNGAGSAGLPGAVYVFNAHSESAWSTSSRPKSTLFNSGSAYGNFGWGVALSQDGTTALIGASGNGAAYIYRNTVPAVTTPNGAGTMTVSPTSVAAGSTTNTLTFTYRASGGATSDGTLDVAIPTNWSPASIPVLGIIGPVAGYAVSTCGFVTLGDPPGPDGEGYLIEVTGVTLVDKATCTITYGYSLAGSDTTAVAPSSPSTSKFTTSEASTAAGKLTGISKSPTVSVKRSARVITMAANGYTTSAKSGKYNVGAKTNDTDHGAAITYNVTPTALDSAGCSVNGAGSVSFTHTGRCTIEASAAATRNFVAASPVQQVVNVYSVLPTITITFNSDGGSAIASRSGVIGSAIKLPAAPKYAGYTFDGWSLLPPGQGGSTLSSPYTLTVSLTIYAQWTQDIENITFNSEGGSEVPGWGGYYGTTITLPAAPTYAGHTFDGWFAAPTGGTALTSPYTLTASVTLYAHWTPPAPTITVKFNSEGGAAVGSLSGPLNTTIALPAAPKYTGHSFDGWFAAPSGGTALRGQRR
jgi:uncharacterized repeat protein (TIGR02543 family)